MNKLTLELTLSVTYIPNGVSKEELLGNLARLVSLGMGEGLLTRETPAEVETHNYKIKEKITTPKPIRKCCVCGSIKNIKIFKGLEDKFEVCPRCHNTIEFLDDCMDMGTKATIKEAKRLIRNGQGR